MTGGGIHGGWGKACHCVCLRAQLPHYLRRAFCFEMKHFVECGHVSCFWQSTLTDPNPVSLAPSEPNIAYFTNSLRDLSGEKHSYKKSSSSGMLYEEWQAVSMRCAYIFLRKLMHHYICTYSTNIEPVNPRILEGCHHMTSVRTGEKRRQSLEIPVQRQVELVDWSQNTGLYPSRPVFRTMWILNHFKVKCHRVFFFLNLVTTVTLLA